MTPSHWNSCLVPDPASPLRPILVVGLLTMLVAVALVGIGAPGLTAADFARGHALPSTAGPIVPASLPPNCTGNYSSNNMTPSFVTTPDNASGYAPLALSWKITINGGTPPYNITATLNGQVVGVGPTGNYTFTKPGRYQIDVNVYDAPPTCRQIGFGMDANAWGPWGPNPVKIVAQNLTGAIPFTNTFTLSVPKFNGNYTVEWGTASIDGDPIPFRTSSNTTAMVFWEPGENLTLGACVSNTTVGLSACGESNPFNVTGASALQVGAVPQNGTSPLNLTVWVNESYTSQLPSGSYLRTEWQTPEAMPSLNSTPGVFHGTLLNPYDIAQYEYLTVWLDAPSGAILATNLTIFYVLPGAGSSPPPWPVLSFSVSPSMGTAPLTVVINATAQGGVLPYATARFAVEDWDHLALNGSPTISWFWNGSNWNGSDLVLSHTFSTPGNFSIAGEIIDSAGSGTDVGSPVQVRAGTPAGPLHTIAAGTPQGGGTYAFLVTVAGGTAPYTVQWEFGDGSLGSSALGSPTYHTYAPGTYTPRVEVRDGAGTWSNDTLPMIVVEGRGGASSESPPLDASPLLLAGIALVIVAPAASLVVLRHRARMRAEGESLVDGLDPSSGGTPPRGP